MNHNLRLKYPTRLIVIFITASLLLTACGGNRSKEIYTIGVVSVVSIFAPIIEGFKAGTAEFGYVEGQNVTYLYNGPTDPQVVDNEIKNLLDRKVDLLFVIANPTVLPTKQAVAGTDMPVVFAMVADPVGHGYVESISHPGGNITGVQGGLEIAKSLEYLVRITPNAKKIYVPYNPADKISLRDLAWLE
jgi:putative ABC transport system substrate-binding protein